MNISLLTYGSRGDVDPFLALSLGFRRAGHNVRLAAPEPFQRRIEAYGVECTALPGDPDRLVADLVQQAGGSWPRMIAVVSRFVVPVAREVLERISEACHDAEVIVHSFLLTDAGHLVAMRMGVPDVSAQLFPVFSPTSEFPCVAFPDPSLGGAYNRLTHVIANETFRRGGRLLYRRVRSNSPGLPPLASWPFAGTVAHRTPILYGFSPLVVPRPRDWRGREYITGYWFLPAVDEGEIDDRLHQFVQEGPPPVYIGFGTADGRTSRRLVDIALGALALVRQRGILSVGQAGIPVDALPDHVRLAHAVPHSWLFPRMAVVVHHGGAGTTAAGLRAGVPNIVVPFTSDNPFWGRRVFRLGVGPRPIPAPQLTAPRLAQAIVEALNDSTMREAASRLAEAINREDGVGEAVACVEGFIREGAC